MAINYFQGDLLKGKFSLRSNDACVAGKQNEYVIPAGSVIKLLFPGTTSTVTISSDVSVASEFGGGTEVNIEDYNNGECSFTLIPSKGALVKKSSPVGTSQALDVVVYDSLGSQIQTFEISDGIICSARKNT